MIAYDFLQRTSVDFWKSVPRFVGNSSLWICAETQMDHQMD